MKNIKLAQERLKIVHRGNAGKLTPLRAKICGDRSELKGGKRRPVVRSDKGNIKWQADIRKFYYDPLTEKYRFCSWIIRGGGTLVIMSPDKKPVEAYRLKPGEKAELVY